MEKNEILKDLDSAFIMMSRIPVAGDNVEAMAVSRAKLRKVFSELEKLDMEGEKNE